MNDLRAAPRCRKWTREMVIEAIRTFHRRYGRPPAIADFHPASARAQGHTWRVERFYSDGDYPNRRQVVALFETWNAAIRAAGLRPMGQGGYAGRRGKARSGPRGDHLAEERLP